MLLALVAQPSPLWFFARAAGFVSLLLLTASVCLGIALTLRLRTRAWPLFLSDRLHGFTALVFFVFLVLHIVTVLLDPFTKFGLADVLVPFASSYRRLWLGLGVAAFELSLALGLSVYLRRFIGYRAWRVLHYGTYAILPMALVHGLATGSDTRSSWGMAIYILCTCLVVSVAVMRLVASRATIRGPFAAALALGVFVLAAWTVSGPLRSGWAVTAGTPRVASAAVPAPSATPSPVALLQPFADRVSGSVDSTSGTALKASGQAVGNVNLAWALDTAGGTLTISTADGKQVCVASLQGAGNQGFVAGCTPPGAKGDLVFVLRLRQRAGGTLTGLLSVQPGTASVPPASGLAPSPGQPAI